MSYVSNIWYRVVSNWGTLIAIGILLTACACLATYRYQLSEYETTYNRSVELVFQSIVQKLATSDATLDALTGLYQASVEMDTSLFTPFAKTFLEEYPFIDSTQFLSYISAKEKNSFVEEIQNTGFSQFRVYDPGQTVNLLHDQPFYLVTSFIEPLTPMNAQLLGMNWIASQVFHDYLLNLAQKNSTALLPAPLFLDTADQLVFLKPTYFGRTELASDEERLQQFSGFFLVILNTEVLVEFDGDYYNPFIDIILEPGPQLDIASFENPPGDQSKADDRFYRQQTITIGDSETNLTAYLRHRIKPDDIFQIMLVAAIVAFVYFVCIIAWRNHYLFQRAEEKSQQQIFKERERAEVTLRSIGDAVITTDVDGSINYLNPVAEKLFQCSLDDAKGRDTAELVNLQILPSGLRIEDPINYYLEITKSHVKQTDIDIVLNINGQQISVDGNAEPMVDFHDELIGSVLVLRDISLEKQLTNELVYLASHDTLTGLVNRGEFEIRLRESLESCRKDNIEHALCYLDMDQFKLINDTCGHIAGDELLKQVAGLLQLQMRDDDIVARLGGDEFGVLIHDCYLIRAAEIAERIRNTLNDYHFTWQSKIFNVSASIGLVMINRLSGNLSDVLSAADLACYAAKDGGRNVVHTYHAEDEEISQKYTEMQWLPRIREAIKNDEFALAIQHIVSLQENQKPTSIYEFLIRWPQPDGSYLSPAIFIPSAERYDLMRGLDRWVIKNAIESIPALNSASDHSGSVMYTINLSGQSIGDPELASFIIEQLKTNLVNAELVCFEVTETVAITNFSIATEFIRQLRNHGCLFALDDFGSGLSSFGYLKRLPLDFLKIDGLFVRDMNKDPVDLAMVRTIHDVARVLNLQTIAEWVEDESILQSLKDIGVDYAQGYHLHKPKMVSELIR